MSTIISSVIKSNPMGRWYIELADTHDESIREICSDIEEYSHKIAKMGEAYNGDIEVFWSTDDNVTPMQIHEVRQQIMAYETEYGLDKELSSWKNDEKS